MRPVSSNRLHRIIALGLAAAAPAAMAQAHGTPVQVSSWKESIEFIDIGLERRQVAQRQTLVAYDEPASDPRNQTAGFVGVRIDTGMLDSLLNGARLRYRLQGSDGGRSSDQRVDFIAQSRVLQRVGAPWLLDVEASLTNPGVARVATGKVGMVVPLTPALRSALAVRTVHSDNELSVVWPFELRMSAGTRTALTMGTTLGSGNQAGASQVRLEWPLSQRATMLATLEHRRFDSATSGRVGVDVRWY